MKRHVTILAILLLSFAPRVNAEPRIQLPTANERSAANLVSWGTVLTNIALDTKVSWDAPNRVRAFELQATRLGVTYGVTYIVKTVVHRNRPCAPTDCGSDQPDASFFSGHTAGAFQALGGPRLAFMLPLAISTGGLRVAAGRHWVSDTLVGAGVGLLASRIR